MALTGFVNTVAAALATAALVVVRVRHATALVGLGLACERIPEIEVRTLVRRGARRAVVGAAPG